MEFSFTSEEEEWKKEVHDFFDREVTPEIREELREKGFSRQFHLKMAQAGILAAALPKEYGGRGLSPLKQFIFNEELTRAKMPFGVTSAIGNTVHVFGGALVHYGTEEQRKRWLPMIVRGELISSQGLTEPNAGSDLASVELRAVEDGDDYILNGTKLYSNALNATHMLTVTRTDPTVSKHKGISLFIVDLSSPGVTVAPMISTDGDHRAEVSFEDVRVPKFNMLGEKNGGWYNLTGKETMVRERTQPTPWYRPLFLFDDLVDFVKHAQRDGQPLGKIPAVRYAMADLATEVKVTWLVNYHTAWMMDNGMDVSNKEVSMAKICLTELIEHFADTAIDILGQFGQLESWGLEKKWVPLKGVIAREYRGCRDQQIGGGTTEIQKNIIAIRGLGLPRPPRAQ